MKTTLKTTHQKGMEDFSFKMISTLLAFTTAGIIFYFVFRLF